MVCNEAVAALMEGAAQYRVNARLVLLGHDSIFLDAVEKRAHKLGFECSQFREFQPEMVDGNTAFIKCNDTYDGPDLPQGFPTLEDPLPACTAATLWVLNRRNLIKDKFITVIGRGKSTSGLVRALDRLGATVTGAHSETPDLWRATYHADVVVCAAPIGEDSRVSATVHDAIIDISGDYLKGIFTRQLTHGKTAPEIIGPTDIGRLTTSILVYWFASRYGYPIP